MSAWKPSNRKILPFVPQEKYPAEINASVTGRDETDSAESAAAQHPGELRREIRREPFLAAIVQDRSLPAVFHCIVQRSADVVFWGQFTTQQEAEQAAELQLDHLSQDEEAA